MWRIPLVAATLAALSLYNYSPAQSLDIPERYQPIIAIVGWAPADVPMLADVVACESGWNSLAVGQAGELGLAQIMPSTWVSAQTDPTVPHIDYWTSASANLYTARVIKERDGWQAWTCYRG